MIMDNGQLRIKVSAKPQNKTPPVTCGDSPLLKAGAESESLASHIYGVDFPVSGETVRKADKRGAARRVGGGQLSICRPKKAAAVWASFRSASVGTVGCSASRRTPPKISPWHKIGATTLK